MSDPINEIAAETMPASPAAPRGRTAKPAARELWILLAIIALAAALRAYHLGYKGLWLDELNYARSAFGDGTLFGKFGLSILDHPPAYLFVTRLMMHVGREDWWMRLIPFLSSVAAVAALWALGRTLFGPITALLAAFVLAITPMHVAYAQEAHSYGVYGLLSVLTLWFLYRAAQDEVERQAAPTAAKPWWRTWLPFALLATLNMYVHYYSFYVAALSLLLFPFFLLDYGRLPAQSLWRNPEQRRSLMRLTAALLTIAVLYLPQVVIGVRNSLKYATNLDTTYEGTLGQAIQWAARAVTVPWQRDPASGVVVLLAAAAGLAWLLWRRRSLAVAFLLLAILPLPPSIYLAYRTGIAFNARRVIFILPLVALVIAVGMMAYARLVGWLWRRRARKQGKSVSQIDAGSRRAVASAALALALVAAIVGIQPLTNYYTLPKQDWKGLGRILALQVTAGDVVAAPPRSAKNVAWYYRPVRTLHDPRAELEAICQQGQSAYFAVSLQEPLPEELQTWVSEHFIEVPLKDVRLYYRQCGRQASDWYGAGADPLFRIAINSSLPFPPTQRAYNAYVQRAAEAMNQPAPAQAVPVTPEQIDAPETSAEERDVADAGLAAAAPAGPSDGPAAAVSSTATPSADELAQEQAGAQETAVALALARLTGNATPTPGGADRRAEAEKLLEAGQPAQALAILQEVVAANPADRAALMSRAKALAALDRTDEALAEYTQITKRWPDYPWALVRRGELFEKAGDTRAALREYRAAVKAAPANADIQFTLAYALARAGQKRDAIKAFEAGLKLDPTREAARNALERLQQ